MGRRVVDFNSWYTERLLEYSRYVQWSVWKPLDLMKQRHWNMVLEGRLLWYGNRLDNTEKHNAGCNDLDQKSDCLLLPGEKYECSCCSQVRCLVGWFSLMVLCLIREIHLCLEFISPFVICRRRNEYWNTILSVIGKQFLIWLSQTVRLRCKTLQTHSCDIWEGSSVTFYHCIPHSHTHTHEKIQSFIKSH